MTRDATLRIVARLSRLLDAERAALLSGDLDRMAALSDEKQALVGALNAASTASPPDLVPLRAKMQRNQALLDGALEGIRDVAARMATMRRIGRSFETYDSHGRTQTIRGEVARRMEKRA